MSYGGSLLHSFLEPLLCDCSMDIGLTLQLVSSYSCYLLTTFQFVFHLALLFIRPVILLHQFHSFSHYFHVAIFVLGCCLLLTSPVVLSSPPLGQGMTM